MKKRILSFAFALVLCLGLTTPALAYDMAKVEEYNVISAGHDHTAAIDENGSLWMWGDNADGQLGIGTADPFQGIIQTTPFKVLDNVVSVSCGGSHTAAIDKNSALWMWGSNAFGQVGSAGVGNYMGPQETPIQTIPFKVMEHVAAVSCGGSHTAAIDQDGALWMWGSNFSGQLGNGYTGNSGDYSDSPTQTVPIKIMDDVMAVSCGGSHTAAIKSDGSLWTWGSNSSGQLGNAGTFDARDMRNDPMQTTPLKIMDNVVAVSCGQDYTVAVTTDGSLGIWGKVRSEDGQTLTANSPTYISGSADTACCGADYIAVLEHGDLWTMSYSTFEKKEGGTTAATRLKTRTMGDVVAVSCGGNYTIAVQTDGTLWTWGDNDYGQLGDGTTNSSATPIQLSQIVMTKSAQSNQSLEEAFSNVESLDPDYAAAVKEMENQEDISILNVLKTAIAMLGTFATVLVVAALLKRRRMK